MRTRVLDKSEWADLPAEGLTALLARTPDAEVYVVEDGERIVGCLAALRVTHLEGLWIDPEYRRKPSVARRLRRVALDVARGRWVWACAVSDCMRRIVERFGGAKLALNSYVLKGEA